MSEQQNHQLEVPRSLFYQTRFFQKTARLWERLGNLESALLAEELRNIAIIKPVYVTGLARSGTTIITELLNCHPELTSHRYCDFPPIYTPFWRNWLRDRTRFIQAKPAERAHGDRIMITEDSPEAVEEVLWMNFFPGLHDNRRSQVLDAGRCNARFDAFYQDHIRKLLLVRRRPRYLAKGNYNITRLKYLLRLFPDARFVIPIRHPVNHFASLIKQDALFREAQQHDPRIRQQLAAFGHFEFGLDRSCIHFGDTGAVQEITNHWDQGYALRGWALYWVGLYRFVHNLLESDEAIARASLVVRYEDLCIDSATVIRSILTHCQLEPDQFRDTVRHYQTILSPPTYYTPSFSASEREEIAEITADTATRFGYPSTLQSD
ncbi:MAG: sulfotransferase [Candidatus Competibacteraceae bacterium]|jgi:hypothetical protein|nr:sulfotransferase [Candidatus Competibacteraceae bacterium]